MSEIGRLDVVQTLKRWFNLKGAESFDLGESLLPVVVVADSALPFSLAYPFRITAVVPAGGAGNFGAVCIHHQAAGTGDPSWLEITGVQNLSASADFQISVNTAAAAALTAALTMLPRRLRGVSDLGGLGNWNPFRGFVGVAPTTELIRLTQGELYRLNYAISQGRGEFAAFNVVHNTANTAFTLYLEGLLHLNEAR